MILSIYLTIVFNKNLSISLFVISMTIKLNNKVVKIKLVLYEVCLQSIDYLNEECKAKLSYIIHL